MKKYDGKFVVLGMLTGISMGMLFKNLLFGILREVIISLAMDELANLWDSYR